MAYTVIDQMHRRVDVPDVPRRIVSLVPSQTELLFDLGLVQEIVGITKFCIHPRERYRATPKIGGTKKFDLEAIHRLQPDLIIGNKEENYQEGIEALAQHYPVWMSDITTLEEALAMIRTLGEMTQRTTAAEQLLSRITAQREETMRFIRQYPVLKAVYLIWHKPTMAAGRGTFIHEMLALAGLENVVCEARYPVVNGEELRALSPEVILLSSEPFPFRHKHLVHYQTLCPEAQVRLADGEMFSWYGSRLALALQYLRELRQELGS